ncbi:hypothetical protein HPB52_013243 [Rhipicephalus sanguineus]|uniref:Uncharacterized protein n=1 Tax=Rhipicephalus sanguineus TaxID=34632 RepID=A0A9D4Q018_RHISA|nr:hypothetical protein HPB52_013243 [Rhipicephalus sanguineus]
MALGSDGSGETDVLLPPAFPRKPRTGSGQNRCVTATGHCIAALLRLLRALLCPIAGCRKRFRGAFAVMRLMPIVIEFVVLGWEYHTYVLVMCCQLLADSGTAYRISRLVGFHVTLLGALWPFERLLRTPLKPVPVCFYVMQRMDSADRSQALLLPVSRDQARPVPPLPGA